MRNLRIQQLLLSTLALSAFTMEVSVKAETMESEVLSVTVHGKATLEYGENKNIQSTIPEVHFSYSKNGILANRLEPKEKEKKFGQGIDKIKENSSKLAGHVVYKEGLFEQTYDFSRIEQIIMNESQPKIAGGDQPANLLGDLFSNLSGVLLYGTQNLV